MKLILNEGWSDYVGLLFDFMIKIHIVYLNLVSIKQFVKHAGPERLHDICPTDMECPSYSSIIPIICSSSTSYGPNWDIL